MDLLFKREQTPGKLAKVQFKLWGKIELDEEEQALINRYRFHDAILIAACQSALNPDPLSAPKIDPLEAELARRCVVPM